LPHGKTQKNPEYLIFSLDIDGFLMEDIGHIIESIRRFLAPEILNSRCIYIVFDGEERCL
jgi:hypothetical protein